MEPLLKEGVKMMISKGDRSQEYKDLLVKYQAVYISAVGGKGALIKNQLLMLK